MLVVDLHTDQFSDVDEREAFTMQLRGTHQLVHTSARRSFWYARNVLKGPFPPGEAAIAGDAEYSCLYARNVLKGPFPPGEAAIAGDAQYSYRYAKDVLRGRFPLGEAAIATDEMYSKWYAREFNLIIINGVFQPC